VRGRGTFVGVARSEGRRQIDGTLLSDEGLMGPFEGNRKDRRRKKEIERFEMFSTNNVYT
jgi:hypothetical protein